MESQTRFRCKAWNDKKNRLDGVFERYAQLHYGFIL
jgi:hypothetical protein